MPELKEQILLDSDKAIKQFTEQPDIVRQYQTRAMAEYKLGNYENAVKALKEAAGVTDDKGYYEREDLIKSIEKEIFLFSRFYNY